MKRRKKNIYFGFGPAKKSERLTVYRRPKYASRSHRGTSRGSSDSSLRSEVAEALVGQGYKRADARKMVARASGSDFNSLFRSAMQKNPRVLPEMNDEQLAAIRKLIRGKTIMAKKRKSKKKRNGKMPAGLKAYWAKKRRAKNSRSKPRKKNRRRRTNPRVRVRTRTVIKYRYRTRKVKRARRRRSNPRRHSVRRIIAPKGLSPKGLQQFRRTVAKLTGKRTRIVPR